MTLLYTGIEVLTAVAVCVFEFLKYPTVASPRFEQKNFDRDSNSNDRRSNARSKSYSLLTSSHYFFFSFIRFTLIRKMEKFRNNAAEFQANDNNPESA